MLVNFEEKSISKVYQRLTRTPITKIFNYSSLFRNKQRLKFFNIGNITNNYFVGRRNCVLLKGDSPTPLFIMFQLLVT